ncbi:hypothetical protein SAMN02745134_00236 [Clostridium acidisoli DSM 12555]|uniref:Tetratricopeptide repeat-containing protein n=1 Tax=Clostridium acidisoli DSM 12555 TaxID=1121291 RepID=A0A1W1WZD5_9CLOT|nr:hypothetical protein [Clostridium acidisoli]SMC17092.1 hypothetical protein SAMN02745134_00236 [Clostridium acidisoli DSM 12555]
MLNSYLIGQKAVCFQYLKEYQKSLDIYDRILSCIDKKDYEKYIITLINATEIYIELKEYDKSKQYLNIILNNMININEENKYLAGLYFELGKIFKCFKYFNKSEKCLLTSLSLAKKQAQYFFSELIYIYTFTNNLQKITNIKNEVSILISKQEKTDNKLIYKLIDLYLKIGNIESTRELISFGEKFI